MTTPSCSLKEIFCRFWLWSSPLPSSSTSYHQLQFSPFLSGKDKVRASKRRKSLIPVTTSRESRVFLVDPHILEHWLFQDLLKKAMRKQQWHGCDDDKQPWMDGYGGGPKQGSRHHPICLDCDSILFEFFLWLVKNDDPSLWGLNLSDLIEFYGAEA